MTARIHSLDRGLDGSNPIWWMIKARASVGSVRLANVEGYVVGSATTWRRRWRCRYRTRMTRGIARLANPWRFLARSCWLARGRLPPHEDMVIGELTDEEAAAFWAAITQA
jgi:hypothetical protein